MNDDNENFDVLVDEALNNLSGDDDDDHNNVAVDADYQSPATEENKPRKPKKSKKRKQPDTADVVAAPVAKSAKKKQTRRVKRVSSTSVFAKEIKRMNESVNEANGEGGKSINGLEMEKEIREAEESAVHLLSELKEFLDRATPAYVATDKYSQLATQMEKHRSESVVIDRIAAIFHKMLSVATAARESCAKLPGEFAQMLLRHESFMRASASSLVPSGISVFAPSGTITNGSNGTSSQSTALVPMSSSSNSTALVTFNGPQSRNTFRLVAESNTRARTSDLQNSYLSTSMMHHNYAPRNTVTATNSARRDAQRRAAQLKAGGEVMPDLYGARQIESSKQQAIAASQQLFVDGVPRTTLAIEAPRENGVD